MRLARQLFVLLAFSFTATPAGSEPPAGLWFDSHGEAVLVKGSIGGRERLRFLIDTGTSRTVLDRRLASRMALPLAPAGEVFALGHGSRAFQAVAPSVVFGPVRVESHPVLVMDFPTLDGPRIDAIIGLDILRRGSFEIDYRAQRIRFGPLPEVRSSLPFETHVPLISVEVGIAGQPRRLVVDTGADHLTLFTERMRETPIVRRRSDAVLLGVVGSGGVDEVDLQSVRLGDRLFATYPAVLLTGAARPYEGFDGLLGGFSRVVRRIGFDFERGRLQWE